MGSAISLAEVDPSRSGAPELSALRPSSPSRIPRVFVRAWAGARLNLVYQLDITRAAPG
jgi:hypothetical protein